MIMFHRMLSEIVDYLDLENASQRTPICCHVFEDNNGAFQLVTNHWIANQMKYLLVKFHWFLASQVFKVNTTKQIVNYLTNGFACKTFEKLYNLAQGL